ncbi:hypothetical protein [Peptoniphilus duerdenii]|uniref:hypothetical protein n=1 Tax=Peptoniphilus duerdenii TaxID=507750 RepID=UPI00288C5E10|nr:hypothetical protein [Peptoniphilus duerdenii]
MKRFLGNLLIVVLAAAAIFQTYYLWSEYDDKSEKVQVKEEFKSEDLVRKVLSPRVVVYNKDKKHYLEYKTDDIFKKLLPDISKIFTTTTLENYEEISAEEYLKLQEEDSIVLTMAVYIEDQDFVKAMGLSEKTEGLNIKVNEIYLSDRAIVLSGGEKHFKLKNQSEVVVSNILKSKGTKDLIEAKTIYELYHVQKNIFIPVGDYIYVRKFKYTNRVLDLSAQDRIMLAQRFISKDIDFIKEIRDEEKDIYVYESLIFKILNDGHLVFEDLNSRKQEEIEKSQKLINSLNFIVDKTGRTEGHYLRTMYDEKNKTKILFEKREDGIQVVPLKDSNPYIEIGNEENMVRNYKERYRRADSDEDLVKYPHRLRHFEYIIGENLDKFGAETVQQVVENIKGVSLVYMDDEDEEELILGMKIYYNDKNYYIDLDKNVVKGVI